MTLVLIAAFGCGTPVDRPEALVLDREACDACGMLISDPRFAAQLVTRDGDRRAFDDPACAFRYIADHGPHLAHVWFRDSTSDEEVWLEQRQVAFLPAAGAPMNGGFAATPIGTPQAVSFGEASHQVLAGGAR